MPTNTYTFLPFVRQGLGAQVSATVGNRPAMQVGVELKTEPLPGGPGQATVTKQVQLYGPGDVIGIDARQVIRTEPLAFTANFEPNYLAAIDYYEEDFCWRYTPAPPAGHRLTPWISLVVLADGEFSETRPGSDRPLPSITVTDAAVSLPRPDQLWAWAHVQVNRHLIGSGLVSNDANRVAQELAEVIAENPDLANSRLVCPRQLEPDTGYHAFVVPTFEAGRLAGLGVDPNPAPPTAAAWGAAGQVELPVYFRWSFRTGVVGDFEFLVRLLKPRVADARVGRRPLDVLDPADGVTPIDDPALGGVLQLGGALQVPAEALDADQLVERATFENWDGGPPGSHPFQTDLAVLVNLGDDYTAAGTAGSDPVIAPPLYGRWHALTTRLLTDANGNDAPVNTREGWPHQLNLDPRHRTAAGFGTAVVQANQEDLMASAWAQVGDVLAANRLIRWFGLGRHVSTTWHRRTLAAAARRSPMRLVQVTAGVLSRVTHNGTTVRFGAGLTTMPSTTFDAPLRRALRPHGRLGRIGRPDPERPPGAASTEFAEMLAVGKVTAAPHRPAVAFPTVEAAMSLIAKGPKKLSTSGKAFVGALRAFDKQLDPGEEPRFEYESPIVRALPSGSLVLSQLEEPVQIGDGNDDGISVRFKDAMRGLHATQAAAADAAAEPRRPTFDASRVADHLLVELTPAATFGKRLKHRLDLPSRLIDGLIVGPDGEIDEMMAYPVFDRPMYEPLVKLSDELFLPNLQLIPENSITLLEPNRPFIESYLVGLNHEMARELLWREYPTDQRGSPFRQFWDVRELLALAGDTPANREKLRDIPPVHTWKPPTRLGSHDHRLVPGDDPRSLVLVIRGELLKRYPNAVIYAHRADWTRKANGSIDRTKPRQLVALTAAEEAAPQPPRSKIRLPQYTALVKPDITFIGFDLDASEVQGETEGANPDPGWFFVIKERPGEVRFGLDVDSDLAVNELKLWNDLAWEHLTPANPGFAEVTQTITLAPAPGLTGEQAQQRNEDTQVTWSAGSDAAEIAYVLYQVPVLVAVHGAEMLRSRP